MGAEFLLQRGLKLCGCPEEKMASQVKVGYSETERSYTHNKSGGDDAQKLNGVYSNFFVVDLILRLLAIGCTFSGAIVMGTNKQTVILPIVGPWPAKYQYSPAFLFVGSRILDISVIFSVFFWVNIDRLNK